MTSFGKWTPRVMAHPKNHIKSSDYEESVPFEPPYMREPEDMQMIMSHSYAKKWNQEKTTFKQKLLEIKNENTVFLMRRYVVRGLGKKLKELELARRVPSRIKVGKKVPFAVRLRPPDESSSKPTVMKSREKTPTSSHHSKRVEIVGEFRDGVFEGLNQKLDELAQTETHLHAEQTGRKFKLYRVNCARNHHHECDCEVPNQSPCEM
uniref:Phosphopantetheine adenylyltransferase n=1 Tax=Lygus hesperus TaxID=30085 RepID=A0A0A9Y2N0_LYGHE